jgi:hypothetical protein
MKGKIRQMTLLVLAIFLLSSLVGCLNQPEEKEELVEGVDYSIEPAEAGWKWFINTYHGYKFKFPEDWVFPEDWNIVGIEETESPDWVSIDEPEHGESYGFFGVEVITREKMREYLKQADMNRYDRQSVAKGEIEIKTQKIQDFELLEYKNISIDGVPSTLIRYAYTYVALPPSKREAKQMDLVIYSEEKGGKVYSISYFASRPPNRADRITENLPIVMEMIDSFEFI